MPKKKINIILLISLIILAIVLGVIIVLTLILKSDFYKNWKEEKQVSSGEVYKEETYNLLEKKTQLHCLL